MNTKEHLDNLKLKLSNYHFFTNDIELNIKLSGVESLLMIYKFRKEFMKLKSVPGLDNKKRKIYDSGLDRLAYLFEIGLKYHNPNVSFEIEEKKNIDNVEKIEKKNIKLLDIIENDIVLYKLIANYNADLMLKNIEKAGVKIEEPESNNEINEPTKESIEQEKQGFESNFAGFLSNLSNLSNFSLPKEKNKLKG